MDILCRELIHEIVGHRTWASQAAKEIVEAIWDALPLHYILLCGPNHMLYVKGRAQDREEFCQGRITLRVSGSLDEEQRRLLREVVGWIEEAL